MSLANVYDFITYVGHEEAVQLTQVSNPDMQAVDTKKVQSGLDEAQDLLEQKVSTDWKLFKPCQLRIARYLLDPYTTRENVQEGYKEAWKWVELRDKKILWT